MASFSQYIVNVPDRSTPLYYPSSLTHEEVRATAVASGFTAVETAELIVSPDGRTLTFRRVAGGTKGL